MPPQPVPFERRVRVGKQRKVVNRMAMKVNIAAPLQLLCSTNKNAIQLLN
ncbi:hypothetical protein [Paraburkholderia silvatlantica]|nr:hypothetical protein [Paraburkholderia silvatlantica]